MHLKDHLVVFVTEKNRAKHWQSGDHPAKKRRLHHQSAGKEGREEERRSEVGRYGKMAA